MVSDLHRQHLTRGLQLLHYEQLYPGEVFKVGLLDGSQRLVKTEWCRFINAKCFRIGASFVTEEDS